MSRILVIDDDKVFVTLAVNALTQQGHEVEYAINGVEGWQTFSRSNYDVVVCDLLMPEQEGVQTIMQIRGACRGVAIIAVSGGMSSGSTGLDVLEIALQLGADATLKKPFLLSELAAAVNQVIGARRAFPTAAQA